jgi:hypothetical protein
VATKIGTINPASTGTPVSGSYLPIPGGWSASTSYSPGDCCLTNLGYYLCLIANVNVLPDTDDAYDGVLYWRLLAPRLALIPNMDGIPWDASRGYQRGSIATIANGLYYQPNDYLVIGQDPRMQDGHWELIGYLVPPGGAPGQILTKNSFVDGDYVWADPGFTGTGGDGGGGIS